MAAALPQGVRAYRAVRAASPGVAFAVGWWLARHDQMTWAHLCWLLIPAIFAVARVTLGPRTSPHP